MTTPLIDTGFRERADKTIPCRHCGGRAAVETYDSHRKDGSWRVEIVRCYIPNRKAKGAGPCPESKTETRMETSFTMPKSNVSKPMVTPSYEQIQFARDLSCTHARIREVAQVANSSLYRWMGGRPTSLDVHNRILRALGQLKAIDVAANAGVAPITGTVRSDFAENEPDQLALAFAFRQQLKDKTTAENARAERQAELEEARAEYLATKELTPETLPEGGKKGEERAEVERLKDCLRQYQDDLCSMQNRFYKTCSDLAKATSERDALKAEAERLSGLVERHREDKGSGVLGPICQQRDELLAVNRDLKAKAQSYFDELTKVKNEFLHAAADLAASRKTCEEQTREIERLRAKPLFGPSAMINELSGLPRSFARQLLRSAWSMLDLHEAQEQLAAHLAEATEGRR